MRKKQPWTGVQYRPPPSPPTHVQKDLRKIHRCVVHHLTAPTKPRRTLGGSLVGAEATIVARHDTQSFVVFAGVVGLPLDQSTGRHSWHAAASSVAPSPPLAGTHHAHLQRRVDRVEPCWAVREIGLDDVACIRDCWWRS